MADDMRKKIEKWQEPPPAKQTKVRRKDMAPSEYAYGWRAPLLCYGDALMSWCMRHRHESVEPFFSQVIPVLNLALQSTRCSRRQTWSRRSGEAGGGSGR